jgi:hypothetical protein
VCPRYEIRTYPYLWLISVLSFPSKYWVLAEGINILKALANQDKEITATHMTDEAHIGQTKDVSREKVSLSHYIHMTKQQKNCNLLMKIVSF